MLINKERKQTMEFAKVRPGTVFTFENKTYFRAQEEAAIDLVTGEILHPANWDECIVHNKASLKLGT